jgi:hypothetical protein
MNNTNLEKRINDLYKDLLKNVDEVNYLHDEKIIIARQGYSGIKCGHFKGIEVEYTKIFLDIAEKHNCMYRILIDGFQMACEFKPIEGEIKIYE